MMVVMEQHFLNLFQFQSNWKSKKAYWTRSLPYNLWFDLLLYLAAYYIIFVIHYYVRDHEKRCEDDNDDNLASGLFQRVIKYFDENISILSKDLTFVLGFYVSLCVKRWWEQFSCLPNPDSVTAWCHALIDLSTEEGIQWATKLMRYIMLAYLLCLRRISGSLMQRFPDSQSLVDTGLVSTIELEILEKEGALGRVWHTPISWAMTMIRRSKDDGVVINEKKEVVKQLARFQSSLEKIDSYHHTVIPPFYRQVVLFAVYAYFTLALIAEQQHCNEPFIPVPIFLILKFVFFIGWLEVALSIDDPWDGRDRMDFQVPLNPIQCISSSKYPFPFCWLTNQCLIFSYCRSKS